MGAVVSIEAHRLPASELAATLSETYGSAVAHKACERERFLAELTGSFEDLSYWEAVKAELARLGPQPLDEDLTDGIRVQEGLMLNKIFVRIREARSRHALIEEAIRALRLEPIE